MHRCRQCEKWMEEKLQVYDRFGVFLLFIFKEQKKIINYLKISNL